MFLQDLMRYRFTYEKYAVDEKYQNHMAETKRIFNKLDFLDVVLELRRY